MGQRYSNIGYFIFIGILAAVLVGFFKLLNAAGRSPQFEEKNVNYEMPRSMEVTGADFDLSDREVDRKYLNPFEKAATAGLPAAKNNPTQEASKKVTKKKDSSPATPDKKSTLTVSAVGNNDDETINHDRSIGGGSRHNESYSTTDNRTSRNLAGEEKSSPRELAITTASASELRQFVESFQQGIINDEVFYGTMKSLLQSQDAQMQISALSILSEFPTLKSFELVTEVMGSLPKELAPMADQFLLSFGHETRSSILVQALQSKKSATVLMAMQVLSATLHGKNNMVARLNAGQVAHYRSFRPLLEQLSNDSSQEIAGLAQSVLSQITTV